jgi:hypothetical protein
MKPWPIYIPSKGRPEGQSFTLLRGLPFTVVVEPQDAPVYRRAGVPNIVVLDKDNEGLCYSRNFILDHAKFSGHKWFWMIDDDITSMGLVVNRRVQKTEAPTVIDAAQQVIAQPNCAIGAMQYQQFAWSATKPVKAHARCESVVAIHAERIGDLRYRFRLKHDKDMVGLVHDRCMISIRSEWTAFANKFSDNPGGLHSDYEARIDENAAREVFAAWGAQRARMEPNSRDRLDVLLDYRGIYLDALRRRDGRTT